MLFSKKGDDIPLDSPQQQLRYIDRLIRSIAIEALQTRLFNSCVPFSTCPFSFFQPVVVQFDSSKGESEISEQTSAVAVHDQSSTSVETNASRAVVQSNYQSPPLASGQEMMLAFVVRKQQPVSPSFVEQHAVLPISSASRAVAPPFRPCCTLGQERNHEASWRAWNSPKRPCCLLVQCL